MSQTFTIDCSTGETAIVPYTAADTANQQSMQAAGQQQQQLQANAATIATNIQTHLGQIETWIQANPSGATLNATQTLYLAKMLVGVGRLLLGLVNTIGQAT